MKYLVILRASPLGRARQPGTADPLRTTYRIRPSARLPPRRPRTNRTRHHEHASVKVLLDRCVAGSVCAEPTAAGHDVECVADWILGVE